MIVFLLGKGDNANQTIGSLELGEIVKDRCETQQHIDTRLRSYLQFISDYQSGC